MAHVGEKEVGRRDRRRPPPVGSHLALVRAWDSLIDPQLKVALEPFGWYFRARIEHPHSLALIAKPLPVVPGEREGLQVPTSWRTDGDNVCVRLQPEGPSRLLGEREIAVRPGHSPEFGVAIEGEGHKVILDNPPEQLALSDCEKELRPLSLI